MNASLSDELESNDSDDKKRKKVVYIAFPATIKGSNDPTSVGVDGESYEEDSDEGSMKRSNHLVSHDTLVKNYTNSRKKCKDLMK